MAVTDLVLEVTNRCMNSCLYCSSSSGPSCDEELFIDDVFNFLGACLEQGLDCVSISGGEPLLYTEFDALIDCALNFDIDVILYTSGRVDSGAFTDWKRLKGRVKKVCFDLQSSDRKVHDQLSDCRGAFDETVESIKAAVSAGLTCECSVVPTKVNLPTLIPLVKFADSLGLSQISFLRFVPQGRAGANDWLLYQGIEEADVAWVLSAIKDYMPEVKIKRRFGGPWAYMGLVEATCHMCVNKLLVRPNGGIYPCEALKRGIFEMGHIVDCDPVKALIAAGMNPVLKAARKKSRAVFRFPDGGDWGADIVDRLQHMASLGAHEILFDAAMEILQLRGELEKIKKGAEGVKRVDRVLEDNGCLKKAVGEHRGCEDSSCGNTSGVDQSSEQR